MAHGRSRVEQLQGQHSILLGQLVQFGKVEVFGHQGLRVQVGKVGFEVFAEVIVELLHGEVDQLAKSSYLSDYSLDVVVRVPPHVNVVIIVFMTVGVVIIYMFSKPFNLPEDAYRPHAVVLCARCWPTVAGVFVHHLLQGFGLPCNHHPHTVHD